MSNAGQSSSRLPPGFSRAVLGGVLIAIAVVLWGVMESTSPDAPGASNPNALKARQAATETQIDSPDDRQAPAFRRPAEAGSASINGQVVVNETEAASGIPISWQIVSIRDAMPATFSGETHSDKDGRFTIEVSSRASVELLALPADRELHSRPQIVAAGSTVTLRLARVKAAGFKLIDSSTGHPISLSQDAVAVAESNFLTPVSMPAETLARDLAPQLRQALSEGHVRLFQGKEGAAPSSISVQLAPTGYRAVTWSFQLRTPRAALLNPEVVAMEPKPDTALARLHFKHADGRDAVGAHFVMIRRIGQDLETHIYRGFDVSHDLQVRLAPGKYECGATVISSSPIGMQAFHVRDSSEPQAFGIVLGPSATAVFHARGSKDNQHVPVVLHSLTGLSGEAVKSELQRVWPDQQVDKITLRGLPPGRYRARWYAGPQRHDEAFSLTDGQVREIVRTVE
ncbi:MAG: hypothetical protein AB8H80_21610 [Planctomycetota bacterium]